MTRPWSPAEIAGAKALAGEDVFPWELLPGRRQDYYLGRTRAVLDAAAAVWRGGHDVDLESLQDEIEAVRGENRILNEKWAEARAENAALLLGLNMANETVALIKADPARARFLPQVRGAGAGEQG